MNKGEKEKILEKLYNCEIFVDVEKNFVEDILKAAKIERYGPKELVRSRGDSCEEILILVEGEAFGLFSNSEGRILQIDHMIAPKLLASAVIFSTQSRYPVDVESVKSSVFIRIEKEDFVKYLMRNEKLLRNYLSYISNSFIFLTDRFYEIVMKNLVQKVCSYLINLINKQNSKEVLIDMTKEELAREFGVTRPALSRIFIELEKSGVITTQGKKVWVKNEKYLRDYAEYGY